VAGGRPSRSVSWGCRGCLMWQALLQLLRPHWHPPLLLLCGVVAVCGLRLAVRGCC